jgi:hypothetical protein
MLMQAILTATLLVLSGHSASAAGCRPQRDLPPGVRVPAKPGCESDGDAGKRPSPLPQRADKSGFIDLGNGGELRIRGRLRVDVGIRSSR